MWDVIVVGGGPAGSAAALAARAADPSASVLVLDRCDFPRDKVCGDGVGPQALDLLATMGLPGVVDDFAPVHRLCLGYLPGEGQGMADRMERPARVVPREVLDARLLAGALDQGASFARHVVREIEPRGDCVVIDGRWTARAVVAADGADSVVRRQIGLGRNGPRHLALAIRGYAPAPAHGRHEQRIVFDRGDWPAYAWSFSIGDGRVNVGYGRILGKGGVTRSRLLRELDTLLPGVVTSTIRWRGHHLPLSSRRIRQPDGRVLLAGDALSLVNPLSGEGIYAAVLSGATAGAAALTPGDPGAVYRAELADRLGGHLRHSRLAVRLARHPRWVDAVLRSAGTDRAVFDDLVALSMGGGTLTRRSLLTILGARFGGLPGLVPAHGGTDGR